MLKVTLLLVLGWLSFGHSYFFWEAAHPDHPNECFHSESNTTMKLGETTNLMDKCESLSCVDGYEIQGSGCHSIGAGFGCWLTKPDYTKEFPQCCPTIKCNEEVLAALKT